MTYNTYFTRKDTIRIETGSSLATSEKKGVTLRCYNHCDTTIFLRNQNYKLVKTGITEGHNHTNTFEIQTLFLESQLYINWVFNVLLQH